MNDVIRLHGDEAGSAGDAGDDDRRCSLMTRCFNRRRRRLITVTKQCFISWGIPLKVSSFPPNELSYSLQ